MMRFGKLRRLSPIGNRRAGFHPAPQTKPQLQPAVTGEPPVPPRNRRGVRGDRELVRHVSLAVLWSLFVVPLLLALDELNDGKIALTAHDYTKAADKFRAALARAEEESTKLEAL